MASDDPLYGAERQMAEHELEAFGQLYKRLSDRLGAVDRIKEERELTEDEIRAAFEELAAEDPAFEELAERLALLKRFRTGEGDA